MADARLTQLLASIERAELGLARAEGAAAQRLANLLRDLERNLVLALQRGAAGRFNVQTAQRLINEISRIAENGLLLQQDWLTAEIPALAAHSAKLATASVGISGFSAESIRDTWAAYEKGETYTELLNQGYQRWWNELFARNEELRQVLQQELTRGATLGLDGNTMTRSLTEKAGQLGIDQADAETWAARLVRMETARINNDIGVGFAQEAGIELFYNYGVPDERQADECAEASQQEPMTLAEWATSKWGLAPRHVGCRCDLLGWSPDWGLDFADVKPELEEAAA